MLNLQSIKKDNSQKFKFGQLLIGLFFYFQNFLPRIGDLEWSKDLPVTTQIKNSIKAIKNTFSTTMNKYFNEFQKKMSMRVRLPEDMVKNFAKNIIFIVTIDFCLMEVIEPREDEMEDMSYEVNYDLLIGYSNNLLASPVHKKKKRLDTIEEQAAKDGTSSSQPSNVKGKKKKVEKAPLTSFLPANTRVTQSVQFKKDQVPQVTAMKQTATKKRGQQLILKVESDDTEEEPKKMKATGKAAKPVKEVPKATDFEKTVKTLGRNRFDNVKKCFDSFDENQKEQIVQQVINYLCQYNRLPQDLKDDISIICILFLQISGKLLSRKIKKLLIMCLFNIFLNYLEMNQLLYLIITKDNLSLRQED